MKPKSPCYNCSKRTTTCHFEGNCKDYDDFKKSYNDYINSIKVIRDVDAMHRSYLIGVQTEKIISRRGRYK